MGQFGICAGGKNDALWNAITLRKQADAAEVVASQWYTLRQGSSNFVANGSLPSANAGCGAYASTADYTASEVLHHLVGQTEGGSSASTNQRAGSTPMGQSSKRFGELKRVSDELLAAGGVNAEAEEETIQEVLHELNASNEDIGAVEHKDWYDNYADGHWRWDHETPHG